MLPLLVSGPIVSRHTMRMRQLASSTLYEAVLELPMHDNDQFLRRRIDARIIDQRARPRKFTHLAKA